MSVAEKLITIAENEQRVYDKGFADGKAAGGATDGYDKGFEEGQKAEYDKFWDSVQNFGNLTDYQNKFANWLGEAFNPKYGIRPVNGSGMFAGLGAHDEKEISLPDIAKENGIVFDFSASTNLYRFVDKSFITDLGYVDVRHFNNLQSLFYGATRLKSLELSLADGGVKTASSPFNGCSSLVNISILHGYFDDDISFQWCPLSKTSIVNVVNALSATATGKKSQLKLTAVQKAFETSSGANDGNTAEEWLNLTATKSNWTIVLA